MESGTTGELIYTVQESDLADRVALGSEDQFPQVFATSRMLALMELTAARVMKPLLKSGELSVGVGVELKHFAPTPVGEEVKVVATYLRLEGKLHSFDIQVFDRAGKVGSSGHTRAIVETSRILESAQARMAKAE
ncbi:MAG: thioesterase [Deltaproteobacteria bacterium]|nr:thioesterase [Deltaproteobacteria bacterium]MBW2659202.1 thioesterase [Deltaproteobacteria bacterium]